ncbi:MAG: hypothetical protein ABSC03_01750 [Verrucomicrobiota bacterium]
MKPAKSGGATDEPRSKFHPNRQTTPAQPPSAARATGAALLMATNSSALLVPATPPATNTVAGVDIREVKPPVEIPSGWTWLWIVLAVLAAVAVGWWFWRRMRRKAVERKVEIIVPPHARAYDRLRAALDLINQPEPFCVAVSAALRTYLEERFDFRAPERTTEEFLVELQDTALLGLHQKRSLAGFLEQCDLVKFAREQPDREALRELYNAAFKLVRETQAGPAAQLGSRGGGA